MMSVFKILYYIIFFKQNFIHSGFAFLIHNKLLLEFIGFVVMFLIIGLSFLLHIYYNKYIDTVKLKEDYDYYKNYLDFYKISNFYLTFMGVFVYFLMSVGIFVILRYITLGYTKDINTLEITFNWKTLMLLLITLICYKKSLDLLFYPEVLKLHLYLQRNIKYIAIADYVRFTLDTCASNLLLKCNHFLMILSSLTYDYETQQKNFVSFMRTQGSKLFNKVSFTKTDLILFKLRKIVLRYTYVRLILTCIDDIIVHIARYITAWLYILPYSLLFIILIYDLSRLELYYIYYGLFIYLIIIIIRKIRKFLHEKDPVLDNILYKYYYERDISGISSDQEDIAKYIENDFKVYYVLYEDRIETTNRMKGISKRIHMIMLIGIGSIITYINRAKFIITLDVLGIEIPIIVLFIPGMIMLYVLYKGKIIDEHLENYKRRYNILYWVLGGIQMLILLALNLKNKSIIFANEVIFDYGLKVTQILTVDEKIKLMGEYINKLIKEKNINIINKKYILENFEKLDLSSLIASENSIGKIKIYIDNMIEIMLSMQEIYIKNIVILNDKVCANIIDIANNAAEVEINARNILIFLIAYVIFEYYLPKVRYINKTIYFIKDKNVHEQHLEIFNNLVKYLMEAIKNLNDVFK